MAQIVPIRPLNWKKLRPDEAERHIRNVIADVNGKVIYTTHANQRSNERRIPRADIERTLHKGQAETPTKGKKIGEWIVKLIRSEKRRREFGVVVSISKNNPNVIIVTVEWED